LTSPISKLLIGYSVFKDEKSLFPEFVPDKLLFREKEIKELAINYRSVVRSENLTKGNHVAIVGSKGSGKTALVKHTIALLKEISLTKIDSIFFNCFSFNRAVSILRSILEYHYHFNSRGISLEEKADILSDILKMRKTHLIICLKNADQLKELDILSLANIENVSLILTQIHTLNSQQLISLFTTNHLRNYSTREFEEIINYRAEMAFKEFSYNKEVIETVIFNSKNTSAGQALRVLHQAGKRVDCLNKDSVLHTDILHILNKNNGTR
jgi:Cdc6-like AAA superfamily ATPase